MTTKLWYTMKRTLKDKLMINNTVSKNLSSFFNSPNTLSNETVFPILHIREESTRYLLCKKPQAAYYKNKLKV